MHSLNHAVLAHSVTDDRLRRARRARLRRAVVERPPDGLRRGAAVAVARLARRLDAEGARQAVA